MTCQMILVLLATSSHLLFSLRLQKLRTHIEARLQIWLGFNAKLLIY